MIQLEGAVGELTFNVQVTRAETGQVENYTLVGYIDEAKLKELQHGSDTLDSGPQRSN